MFAVAKIFLDSKVVGGKVQRKAEVVLGGGEKVSYLLYNPEAAEHDFCHALVEFCPDDQFAKIIPTDKIKEVVLA